MKPKVNTSLVSFFLTVLFLSASLSSNQDMTAGENLYQERHLGLAQVKQAKTFFWRALMGNTNLEQKRTAVERIARLSVLAGHLAPYVYGQKSKGRGDVFKDCMAATEYISPNVLGVQTPEYYYWKATCMSLRAAYSKKYVIDNLFNFKDDMMNLVETGGRLFPIYDGGGFDRLKAGIFINSKDVKISGLYNPKETVRLCDKALEVNSEYMIAYLFKAQALYELKQKSEAYKMMVNLIPMFEDIIQSHGFKTIPNGPENLAVLQMMKDFKKKIQR